MIGYDYIFCDLDGTLCDIRHRQHLAQAGAWDEFHSLMPQDEVRDVVWSFLDFIISESSVKVVFLTGRPESLRYETMEWLQAKCNLCLHDDYCGILMRPKDDWRSDTVVKTELMEEFLRSACEAESKDFDQQKSRVLILDDRDRVVAHFRDQGYQCWQVNEGAF